MLVQLRLGQGAFRVLVTGAYQRRCAVTGERTLPVLDAGHIKPYAMSAEHRPRSGSCCARSSTRFRSGY